MTVPVDRPSSLTKPSGHEVDVEEEKRWDGWDPFCPKKSIGRWLFIYLGLSPLPVRVTTRIITFLVGNPYKPSFPLLLGGGTTQYIPHYLPSFFFRKKFPMAKGPWRSSGLGMPRHVLRFAFQEVVISGINEDSGSWKMGARIESMVISY